MSNLGSKASNLIRIRDEFGLPVPSFEVLQFRDLVLNQDEVQGAIDKSFGKKASPKIEIRLNEELIETLTRRLPNHPVSIRTSAALEDGDDASFAGQYLTLLEVSPSIENLTETIRSCIESAFSPRVLEYAAKQGFARFIFDGSVIVQQMFYGTASGVLFSEDGYGNFSIAQSDSWNNQVVEGQDATEYKISRAEVFAGTNSQRLPSHIIQLAQYAKQIESKLGSPVDIEWATKDGQVQLLQFRPLTTKQIDYVLDWDSTNISENYPGITLPLTYSVIRELYAGVYPAFLRLLGTSERKLRADTHAFDNMLGYLNGQVYYRISNWYALLKFLPGKNNQQFFEAMLNPVAKRGAKRQKPNLNLSNLIALTRFLILLANSERLSRKFKKRFASRLEFFSSYQPEFVNAETLLAASKSVRDDLLTEWAVPILNDIKLMVFHGLLQKSFFKEDQNEAYLEFLQGLTDRASIRPLVELTKLGEYTAESMRDHEAKTITELRNSEGWPALAARAATYIDEFSARTPNELKLETVRISDRIEDILGLAISAYESGFKPLEAKEGELPWPQGMPRWKRPLLRWVADNTRRAIDWRERFRFNRAQTFDLSRRSFDAIGKVFESEKVLDNRRDIYWLTKQEIDELVNGHAWTLDAKRIVKDRKTDFKAYEKLDMPLAVRGAGILAPNALTKVGESSAGALHGKGVAPGVFTGEVIVTREFDPNLDVRGKILVVHHIDPGWTLLFTQAAGIVAERGNALSHAAIIAREIGIPAIVAVERATAELKSGDVITINGILGTISSETN